MRITAAFALALLFACATAVAQTTDADMKGALGEVAGEMQVCGDYFSVISRCIKPQKPDIAATYKRAADKITLLAIQGQLDAGLSREAILAQDAYYTKAMMKAMNGNCSNIQVLLNRYMDFCKQLSQDADPRLKEWIACIHTRQQSCGGPGLP